MESDKFDNLVRGAFKGASRRGVMRVGVGALAASALATMGLRTDDAVAKKKKKKICNCTSSDPASCTDQKVKKSQKNSILSSNPCAYSGSCTGVSGCPATCTGDTPVTCGEGCCPATFSKCCLAEVSDYPPGTQTCNPTTYTCCSASTGGGSCPPDESQCCPPTEQQPFGYCALATDTCCTSEQGGGTCEDGAACCNVDDDCDGGAECVGGCCEALATERSARRNKGRVTQRFRMAAQ